jgi:hypothetical protein
MAHAHAPTLQQEKLSIGSVSGRLGIPGLFIGVIALVAAAWLGLGRLGGLPHEEAEHTVTHFFYSYLTAYSFFMALTLGALGFVLIQHLARAGWSVTVRRLAEGLSLNMFLMVLLVVPFVIPVGGESAVHRFFHWFHEEAVRNDAVLTAKRGYLNPQFFAIRMAIYFTVWCLLAWFYSAKSAEQDRTGNPRTSVILEKMGAPAIVFFGFSLTAFAIDWVMSLNPHWFSTIFGVYYFAGAMLSAFSTLVLLALALQKRGLIGNAISDEHYHDLGKWMFAFTFFWGYIAFSQYMLIWYANLPEETQFYIPRQVGHWGSVSILLLIVHLLIPFPGLLSRHVKRKNAVIAFWAVWSLCACALDQFWLIMPNIWISKIPAEVGNPEMTLPSALPLLIDSTHNIYQISATHAAFSEAIEAPLRASSLLVTVLCFIGIGGIYLFSTMLALRNKALVPLKDPRLPESLAFENI